MKLACLWCLLVMLAIPTRSDAATRAGWVDVGDHVRIHYLQAGPDDASRTLLLIPGWTVSSSIWSKQIAYFEARGFRVIAVDSRSQGGSTVVTTGNAPENRAADIAQVIEQLKVRNLVLVGWSQGVQDVAAYVARYGAGKTDGFVLVDGPVSGGQDDVRGSPAFVAIIMRGMAAYSTDAHAYTDGLMHAIISTATPASVYTKLDEEASKTPVDVGVSMLMQDLFTKDRRSSLPLFSKPTLVIASAKSPLLDAQRNMLKSLPHAKLTVVENASHAVFFDQPDVFNHDLDGFIASLGAPQSAPSP